MRSPFVIDLTRLPRPERSGAYGVVCALAFLFTAVTPRGGGDSTLCSLFGVSCPAIDIQQPDVQRDRYTPIYYARGGGGKESNKRCIFEARSREQPAIVVFESDPVDEDDAENECLRLPVCLYSRYIGTWVRALDAWSDLPVWRCPPSYKGARFQLVLFLNGGAVVTKYPAGEHVQVRARVIDERDKQ